MGERAGPGRDTAIAGDSFAPAMLCAWFDLAPADRQEVCEWHNREHLPERLAVPGFRCGRRFAALNGSPEYLIVYDVATVATLSSPDYLSRLNAPTAWTRKSLGRFRNSIRVAARLHLSRGVGLGGCVLSLRLGATDTDRLRSSLPDALARIAELPGVVAVRLAKCDVSLTALPTEEHRQVQGGVAAVEWIVLVEAISPGQLREIQARYLSVDGLRTHGAADPVLHGIYQLQACCLPQYRAASAGTQ